MAGAILQLRPDLGLVYFGDSLNMPYGGRTPEQISRFAHRSIEFLKQQGIDILAVGCNASNSVLGQGELKSFGLPVYDLVSSTIDWLRSQEPLAEPVGLVATQATINSRYWQRKLGESFPQLILHEAAAPEFVPMIEAPRLDEAAIQRAIRRYLQPLVDSGATTLIHGCTHYPLLEPYMREVFPKLKYIDPARCLAMRLVSNLAPAADLDAPRGRMQLFSSLPSEAFYRTGERVFGYPIRALTSMYIVNPNED